MSAAVPTLPIQQGASQYITVGGTQLPLPPNARLDLAYQWTYTPANTTGVNPQSAAQFITVPGNVIEIPLSYNVALQTTSDVVNRVVVFVVRNDQTTFNQIPAERVQPASRLGFFDFNISSAGSYEAVAAFVYCVAGIPTVSLSPGTQWGVFVSSSTIYADTLEAAAATCIRIPTGPAVTAPPPSVASLLT